MKKQETPQFPKFHRHSILVWNPKLRTIWVEAEIVQSTSFCRWEKDPIEGPLRFQRLQAEATLFMEKENAPTLSSTLIKTISSGVLDIQIMQRAIFQERYDILNALRLYRKEDWNTWLHQKEDTVAVFAGQIKKAENVMTSKVQSEAELLSKWFNRPRFWVLELLASDNLKEALLKDNTWDWKAFHGREHPILEGLFDTKSPVLLSMIELLHPKENQALLNHLLHHATMSLNQSENPNRSHFFSTEVISKLLTQGAQLAYNRLEEEPLSPMVEILKWLSHNHNVKNMTQFGKWLEYFEPKDWKGPQFFEPLAQALFTCPFSPQTREASQVLMPCFSTMTDAEKNKIILEVCFKNQVNWGLTSVYRDLNPPFERPSLEMFCQRALEQWAVLFQQQSSSRNPRGTLNLLNQILGRPNLTEIAELPLAGSSALLMGHFLNESDQLRWEALMEKVHGAFKQGQQTQEWGATLEKITLLCNLPLTNKTTKPTRL